MLISLDYLRETYDLSMIRGVLHIGAHLAEEATAYFDARMRPVYWVEMNPELIPKLKTAVSWAQDNTVIHAAVAEPANTAELRDVWIASNGESSSLLRPTQHCSAYPHITFAMSGPVPTYTIDQLVAYYNIPHNVNFLNMDIQGMELAALKGATKFLDQVKVVYTEVNRVELYEGCAKLEDIDAYLTPLGFNRVELTMTGAGWGDAVYIRE